MKLFQVDAFANQVFKGNPAAVCPLDNWLSDEVMQQIAMENNLSETAFFVHENEFVNIRWFTPIQEVDLCGHATMAAAHVIFNHLGYTNNDITFNYGGGTLYVKQCQDKLIMNFPAVIPIRSEITENIISILGIHPVEIFEARDLMVVFKTEKDILDIEPDFTQMKIIKHLGVIVTAPGNEVDFVSRFFAPNAGIDEDPVTGSAHCMLIPYWAKRLRKNDLDAIQISKREGILSCKLKGERVEISGKAVTYLEGEIFI